MTNLLKAESLLLKVLGFYSELTCNIEITPAFET